MYIHVYPGRTIRVTRVCPRGYTRIKRRLLANETHVGSLSRWTRARIYIYIYVRLLTRLLAVRLRGVTQPRSERNNAGVRAFSRRFFVRAIGPFCYVRVITSFLSPFFKLKDFIIARDGFSYELKFRSFLNRSKLWDWKLLERSSRERLFVPDGATKANSEDRGEDTNRKSCFSSLPLRICSFEHRFDSFHLFKTKSRILQSVG